MRLRAAGPHVPQCKIISYTRKSVIPASTLNSTLSYQLFTTHNGNFDHKFSPADRQDLSDIAAISPSTLPLWPGTNELIFGLLKDIASSRSVLLPEQESWICRPITATASSSASDGTDAGPGSDNTLLPGSSCAVPLVVGDAQLGVIGTVTWVQDVFQNGGHRTNCRICEF